MFIRWAHALCTQGSCPNRRSSCHVRRHHRRRRSSNYAHVNGVGERLPRKSHVSPERTVSSNLSQQLIQVPSENNMRLSICTWNLFKIFSYSGARTLLTIRAFPTSITNALNANALRIPTLRTAAAINAPILLFFFPRPFSYDLLSRTESPRLMLPSLSGLLETRRSMLSIIFNKHQKYVYEKLTLYKYFPGFCTLCIIQI